VNRKVLRRRGLEGLAAVNRVERIALIALFAFTVAALAGFGIFGRNPSLLVALPDVALRFYGASFSFFAQAHVWLAGAVLLAMLVSRSGFRWLPALALLYALSLSSELAGTRWGVPFGPYRYGDALGPKWFGLVPLLIPLSWFCMAVPSWSLAGRVTGRRSAAVRILAGSFILLAWDLSLDPAMSYVTRYWFWGESGAYYGMPWLNLLGWYITGLALMAALAVTRSGEWLDRFPAGVMSAYYGANLLLPLGMNAISGLWGAVLAGVLPLVLLVLVALAPLQWAQGSRAKLPEVEGAK